MSEPCRSLTPTEDSSFSDPSSGGVAVAGSPPYESHTSLHGLGIRLTLDHPEVHRAVSRILRYFGFATADGSSDGSRVADDDEEPREASGVDGALRLEILTAGGRVEPEGPSVAAETYSGLETRRFADGISVRGPGLAAFLRPSEGRGRARVVADRWSGTEPMGETEITFVLLCLMILMRRRGIYPMHAAALEWQNRGLLIVATGGAGKSTLTVGLVQAGWKPLSDDSILLRSRRSEIEALALRRNLYLHPDAAGAFPELAELWRPCPLSKSPKHCLPVGEVFPGQAGDGCVPRLLLFPTIVDQPVSELRPLPAAHALGKLIGQSFLVFLEPDRASEQIDLLRRLVAQSACFELRAGHDLGRRPESAASILAPLLDSPTESPDLGATH